MLHAIVMAGGSGTRFWPASRAALPKQLLPLAGDRTLLEDTVARLDGLVPPERMMVVTSERLLPAVRRQLPQLPERALVGEPCKRDTAPCVGLAALLVARHDPEATMAVMPSDHVIAPAETFRTAILQAAARYSLATLAGGFSLNRRTRHARASPSGRASGSPASM